MSDAYIVRRGGGANLNYKVVGGTSVPSSPAVNTIWVNTSTAITSHVFSSEQPTSPVEGMVWFQIGTQSAVLFNALKKNGIILHPLRAKQYISGAWVTKTAKSYQGSAWLEWIADTYLYNNGDTCDDITGGWQGRAWAEDSGTAGSVPLISFNANSMVVTTNGGNYARTTVEIKKDFDFTHFKTITAIYSFSGSVSETASLFMVIPRNKTYWGASHAVASKALAKGTEKTATLDVSAISGAYDVAFGIRCTGGTGTLTVKSVLCVMED